MPSKHPHVELVEATPDRYVLDIPLDRVIVEPDGVRFHRNGRGRGSPWSDPVIGNKGQAPAISRSGSRRGAPVRVYLRVARRMRLVTSANRL
jgi:hypothetical protein